MDFLKVSLQGMVSLHLWCEQLLATRQWQRAKPAGTAVPAGDGCPSYLLGLTDCTCLQSDSAAPPALVTFSLRECLSGFGKLMQCPLQLESPALGKTRVDFLLAGGPTRNLGSRHPWTAQCSPPSPCDVVSLQEFARKGERKRNELAHCSTIPQGEFPVWPGAGHKPGAGPLPCPRLG